jgi:hypothetical protein
MLSTYPRARPPASNRRMLSTWVTKRGLFVPRSPHAAPVVSQHMPSTLSKSAHCWCRSAGISFLLHVRNGRLHILGNTQRPADSGQAVSRPSVDVAMAALMGSVGRNEQRSRLVTCERCKNVRSKRWVVTSMQRQGYKNAAPGASQLELRKLFPHPLLHALHAFLAADSLVRFVLGFV